MLLRDLALPGLIKAADSLASYGVSPSTGGYYKPPTPAEFKKSMQASKLPELGFADSWKLRLARFGSRVAPEFTGRYIVNKWLNSTNGSSSTGSNNVTNTGAASGSTDTQALIRHVMASKNDIVPAIYTYLRKNPDTLSQLAEKAVRDKREWYSDLCAPIVRTIGRTEVGKDMIRSKISDKLTPTIYGDPGYYEQFPDYWLIDPDGAQK